ncbi:MAG: hypothetical protein ABT08_06625 [Microbacterium sp. SCN 71-21]|uniref:hypothetical protein n=1 Tax=Microbacterium sp. SCN 71-21 TaxID=1660116 RepID=UPI00086A6EDE|nr:hypothetical protein [Microbacterium sp. SCN 71-21]ODU77505.1 MAG: hypothetical protein ABT08_06625 [Microbacterium sp. SCN 71-21]
MNGLGRAASGALDTGALVAPVDPAAVRAFRKAHDKGMTAGRVVGFVIAGIVTLFALAVIVPIVIGVLGSVIVGLTTGDGASPVALVFVLAVVGVLAIFVSAAVRTWRSAAVHAYRLDAFARANGLTYTTRIDDPNLPGVIFDTGENRKSLDFVRTASGRDIEIANYRYETGSDRDRTTHRWGYVAVRLDVPLPNIVLDAVGNNRMFGASNLPADFARSQHLSLEGDFDRYFRLYCPAGYERDALYLFTPDIMARFIDSAAALDVEIVDDRLFLYAERDLVTLDPATWQWLDATIGALTAKLDQWARWRDERVQSEQGAPSDAAASTPHVAPPPVVAPAGRRLRRRASVLGGIAAVVFIGFWLWSLFGDAIGRLVTP